MVGDSSHLLRDKAFCVEKKMQLSLISFMILLWSRRCIKGCIKRTNGFLKWEPKVVTDDKVMQDLFQVWSSISDWNRRPNTRDFNILVLKLSLEMISEMMPIFLSALVLKEYFLGNCSRIDWHRILEHTWWSRRIQENCRLSSSLDQHRKRRTFHSQCQYKEWKDRCMKDKKKDKKEKMLVLPQQETQQEACVSLFEMQ